MPARKSSNSRVKMQGSSRSVIAKVKGRNYKMSTHIAGQPKSAYAERSIAYGKIYAREKHEIELMTSGLQRFAEKQGS